MKRTPTWAGAVGAAFLAIAPPGGFAADGTGLPAMRLTPAVIMRGAPPR